MDDQNHLSAVRGYSYMLIGLTLGLVGWGGLGTPFITILFAYFVLEKLGRLKNKALTVAAFFILAIVLCTVFGYFLNRAVSTLPRVITASIPAIIEYAKDRHLELPFADWDTLKEFVLEALKNQFRLVSGLAKDAVMQSVLLVIGIVVAVSIYVNPTLVSGRRVDESRPDLYTVFTRELAARFTSLYRSFATVMGAQLIISAINTGLTAGFLLGMSLPYAPILVVVTFLCGLLPIVGNLLSNAIIVTIAFTVSPGTAGWALVFLVTVHKLEYFLNSKIIGRHIKNPMWLTLIGLIVGERLMGITGMILAPVLLHFIKEEASQIRVTGVKKEAGSERSRPVLVEAENTAHQEL